MNNSKPRELNDYELIQFSLASTCSDLERARSRIKDPQLDGTLRLIVALLDQLIERGANNEQR